ncbi:PREDICTED: unconventional myosin-XV-like, partial [Priapulus caudatus]|uniref:Unconventional myosin-XV-like n=1 Tax=Priapulus caudatus TaxID=37621 RepID=A0ABM1ETR5_PRICU
GALVWFDPGLGYPIPGEVVDLSPTHNVISIRSNYGEKTYTGSILVAVNPYKMFDIYGLDMVKKYEDKILGQLPPHLFAIANAAYTTMSRDREDQVIVISGVITGAQTKEYLLEKSRIVKLAAGERNYHVFYEMLAGLPQQQKDKYGLQTVDKYFYLNQRGEEAMRKTFTAAVGAGGVGFSSEEQTTVIRHPRVLCFTLGNIYFNRLQQTHQQEGVDLGSDVEIKWTSHLLGIDDKGLAQALTTKITEARNERVMTSFNIDQALDARDAIAKALYARLFCWLVKRINSITGKGDKRTSIAVLDIFGFEDFAENSFEQLCINYANETLQFYFNKHIFHMEQQEYAREKIAWQPIAFTDNQACIDLIAKKPIGILHILDDESNFPKATNVSFLEKCHFNHSTTDLYSRPRMSAPEFAVRHYAGNVWYNVDGFLDKNRDTLRLDVVDLLIGSKNPLISKLFKKWKDEEMHKTVSKPNGRHVALKPRTPTVAARFHESLLLLRNSAHGDVSGHEFRMVRDPIQAPFLPKQSDVDYQDSLMIFKLA